VFIREIRGKICVDQHKSAAGSVWLIANCYLLIADRFLRAMLFKSLLQPRGNRHGIARLNIMALHHVDKLSIAQ
jgi:hypothetical protein